MATAALPSPAPHPPDPDDDAVRIGVRVLGPLEVVTARGTVALGGPRLRTLFGLLALRAPAIVSRDALIDGVWDTAPPANAGKTLRAHVAYLRRRLSAAGAADVIATRPPGYATVVAPEMIDVHQFERGVEHGRRAAAAGAYAAAADQLDAALALWRGDVLADCPPGQWARAETGRLAEVRLDATEELLAAQLALGQHARVTAAAEALARRHPLRERLWELLMLALYRGGRQADALVAYHRARAVLVEELGVEPGPGLRRLEADILAGRDDPAPGPARAVVTPAAGTAEDDAREAGPRPALDAGVVAPRTSLVGRDADVADLTDQLDQARLVTLTGTGGTGKTRLALAVAAGRADAYVDGVAVVDLAAVTDPDQLPAAVAAALAVPVVADDPQAALVRHLAPRRTLLVVDNCEHLAPACAALVDGLLRTSPGLTVLATSRQALDVPGEVVRPVAPLSIPDMDAAGLAEVLRCESARLFVDRADPESVRSLTDADAPALAAICRGLDGLPLAIELAAARTAALAVPDIAVRLHHPALLRSTRRPGRPDHRTLDATIAWSYDLLAPPARAALRRVAVFVGGFALPAAEAVLAGDPDIDALDVLTDLVTKSLVVVRRGPGGARYRLLETIRRWAGERLATEPDEHRDARDRHASHFLDLAEQAGHRLAGPDIGAGLDLLTAEYGNLRAAQEHLAGRPEELRLVLALASYRRMRGGYRETRDELAGAIARCPDAPADLVGRVHTARAQFAYLVGDYAEAAELGRRALTMHLGSGERIAAARALCLLGSVDRERGDYAASQAHLDRALVLAEAPYLANVYKLSGFTAWLRGDVDTAQRHLVEALRRHDAARDEENVASDWVHLAAVACYRGELGAARRLAGDALAWFGRRDVKEGVAWALDILGRVALREGRLADAVAMLGTSLDGQRALGDRWREASVTEALAAAHVRLGDHARAADLLDRAAAIRAALGVPVPTVELPDWRATRAALRVAVPDAARTG